MDEWTSKQLPERLPFSKKRLPKKVVFSYILDYVIIVALVLTFTLIDKVHPFHQPFALENYTLHYPFATKERIPVPLLCVICVGAPAVIIAFYTLVIDGLFSHQASMPPNSHAVRRLSGRYRMKDRLWELNCGILGLGLSVAFAFTVTGALKNAIGKPRPDLIDRCEIDWTKVVWSRGGNNMTLQTVDICTQKDENILQDGFKSFPSGHSSTAFAGLFYLSLYLAAKLHILDSKGEVWKAFIVLIPTVAAALVAGSRIMDARHHPFDVLSGSAMGLLIAWGSYRQYFPPVSETWRKGRAYPIRAWGKAPEPPTAHPTFTRADSDLRPLRPLHGSRDVEDSAAASGFSSTTAVPPGPDESGRNVFREQISQSQRRRQDTAPFAIPHSDTMPSTTAGKATRYQNQMPSSNPFARERDYDYSSSEDDDSYELQQTYPHGGAYNPVAGQMTDTGYHPPAGMSPRPTPPPPSTAAGLPPTGDLGEARANLPPAVLPHATGTTS